jgi:hypothetical protein
MVHDLSQDTAPVSSNSARPGDAGPRQAVAGLMPPQLSEALIREVWPSVTASSAGLSKLAAGLIRTVVLAPLGWLLLAPPFGKVFMPFLWRRYTLTNRRLLIRKGVRLNAAQELPLAEIDDVRLVPDSVDAFYRSGDLEVLSKGQVAMTLRGVPEPESFRHAILNAIRAWVPEKARGPFLPASAPVKA